MNNIKITPVAVSQVYEPADTTDANRSKTSVNSISDLYDLVKTFDKNFTAGKEVPEALRKPEGTPKVFYHLFKEPRDALTDLLCHS